MSDSSLPAVRPGKMNASSSMRGNMSSSSSAGGEKGTRCGRPDFKRGPGMCQVFVPRSISVHLASRASPDLAAVNITNSKQRALIPSMCRNRAMNAGRAASSSARWFFTGATVERLASSLSRLPFYRAGFSPWRNFIAVAQSSTSSTRLRTRLIVSFLVNQCGLTMVST